MATSRCWGCSGGTLCCLGTVTSLRLPRLQGHALPPWRPEAIWHNPSQSEEKLEILHAAQAFVLFLHPFPTLQTTSPRCPKQARTSVSLKKQRYTFKIRHMEALCFSLPQGTQMQRGSVSQTETNWNGHRPCQEVTEDWYDAGNSFWGKERNLYQKYTFPRAA